jgi:hypothetical protein
VGAAIEGWSSVPTRRITNCGRASDALVTGVPHAGQNPRCIVFPDAAFEVKWVRAPVMFTCATSNTALTVADPDPQYWQSRHQHWRTTIGGADTEYRTAPQMQPPVMGAAALSVMQ